MAIILANSVAAAGIHKTVQELRQNKSSLDAIESGIRLVESDPEAGWVGYGGYPNLLGTVELDAGIMDGATLQAGAVGALAGYLHPISVARKVMERLPHVFIVGSGAARFAKDCGAEMGDNLTDKVRKNWIEWLDQNRTPHEIKNWPDSDLTRLSLLTANPKTAKGTTVFLAQDNNGNFSAGSSTSGWSFKYPSRLGDSPVIGSGIYADNRFGAVACTGMGELTLRAATARSVILYLKMKMTLEEACYEALNDLRSITTDFRGGVTIYAIDTKGNRFVLSVKALTDGLPECDSTYWYWDGQFDEPRKFDAILGKW